MQKYKIARAWVFGSFISVAVFFFSIPRGHAAIYAVQPDGSATSSGAAYSFAAPLALPDTIFVATEIGVTTPSTVVALRNGGQLDLDGVRHQATCDYSGDPATKACAPVQYLYDFTDPYSGQRYGVASNISLLLTPAFGQPSVVVSRFDNVSGTYSSMAAYTFRMNWGGDSFMYGNASSGTKFCMADSAEVAYYCLLGFMPPTARTLAQYKTDRAMEMVQGYAMKGGAVTLEAVAFATTTGPFEVQFEVRQEGRAFAGIPTNIAAGAVASGNAASVEVEGLAPGNYFWQARIVERATGATSPWRTFGDPEAPSFIVLDPTTPGKMISANLADITGRIYCNSAGCGVPLIDRIADTATGTFYLFSEIGFHRWCEAPWIVAYHDAARTIPAASYKASAIFASPTTTFACSLGVSQGGQVAMRYDNLSFRGDLFYGLQASAGDSSRSVSIPISSSGAAYYRLSDELGVAFGAEIHTPVVIVPGIMGTRLSETATGREVWPNAQEMANSASDSYLDALGLAASGLELAGSEMTARDIVRNVTGTYTLPLLGITFPFEKDFYKPLFDSLVAEGYIEGRDLFVAPYDWRFGVASSAEAIHAVVKNAAAHAGDGRVNVVAHSMGGLVVKEHLTRPSSTDLIKKIVLVGVPQLGAPQIFKVLQYGDDLGFGNSVVSFLNAGEIKKISQNMPGVYDLLPSRKFVQIEGGYVFDKREGNRPPLSFDESAQFMTQDPADSRNPALLARADLFHASSDALAMKGVDVYNLAGCGNPTVKGFVVQGGGTVDLVRGNGDGSVPLGSALALANDHQNYFSIYRENGIDHAGLVKDARATALIRAILDDATSTLPLAPLGWSGSVKDCFSDIGASRRETTLEVSVHSPVVLHAYDKEGRHTGPNGNGEIETRIPGSSYDIIGGNRFMLLPAAGTYDVLGSATASGSFTMKVKSYDDAAALLQEATYVHLPIGSASATVKFTLSSSTLGSPVSLDAGIDGGGGRQVAATALLDASSSLDIDPPLLKLDPLFPSSTFVGATTTAIFSFLEEGVGVATSSAIIDGKSFTSGDTLIFRAVGTSTIMFSAEDNAGNYMETTYMVRVEPATATATSTAVVFLPLADTYIGRREPNKNAGLNGTLRLGGFDEDRILLRFDESSIRRALQSCAMISAKLRMPVVDSVVGVSRKKYRKRIELRRMTTAWTEVGATWSCPIDRDITNASPDCGSLWNMDRSSGAPFEKNAFARAGLDNDMKGVTFDVANEMKRIARGSTSAGWLLKSVEAEKEDGEDIDEKNGKKSGDDKKVNKGAKDEHLGFSSRETDNPPTLTIECRQSKIKKLLKDF